MVCQPVMIPIKAHQNHSKVSVCMRACKCIFGYMLCTRNKKSQEVFKFSIFPCTINPLVLVAISIPGMDFVTTTVPRSRVPCNTQEPNGLSLLQTSSALTLNALRNRPLVFLPGRKRNGTMLKIWEQRVQLQRQLIFGKRIN